MCCPFPPPPPRPPMGNNPHLLWVYRALYAVLLHPEVAKSGKSPMFLSLVFKAMKADVSTKRVAAFAKRLLQVAQEQQPAFTCGCLLMLSELLKVIPCHRCGLYFRGRGFWLGLRLKRWGGLG